MFVINYSGHLLRDVSILAFYLIVLTIHVHQNNLKEVKRK